MMPPTTKQTVAFCRDLRDRGLAVTASEVIDAVRTLVLIDDQDREEAFLGLRAVLTSRLEDFPAFDEAFADFWDGSSIRTTRRNDRDPVVSQKPGSARRSESQDTSTALEFLLRNWGAATNASGTIDAAAASNVEKPGLKDFTSFGSEDLDAIRRTARAVVRKLARSPSRRWKPVRRGKRVHYRHSLRNSMKTGGELVQFSFKKRKHKKTRLVVICDISGSMDLYTRLLLMFVYCLQNSLARVETFVFSTSLHRITAQLKDNTYERALEQLSSGERGWSGGTLIGECIRDFISLWGTRVDRRTTVVILSDGWDTGEPEELAAALADLRRRAGKLIWLNPLLGSSSYQPLTIGMQAALPYVDAFAPLYNLESLRALGRHLAL
jgi:uncharacterized protein with von Willebrand factor type A (vWA) domain